MDKFLIEFNNISNNKYDYLRLKSVSANDEYNRLNIIFYVPYDIYFDKSKFSEEEKGEIFDICTKIIPEDINIKIDFDVIQVIPDTVKRFIAEYIRKNYYKALEDRYIQKDIKVVIKDAVSIWIPVDTSIYSFCINKGLKENIEEYLNSKYNLPNFVYFTQVDIPHEIKERRIEKNKYIDDGIVVMTKGYRILGHTVSSFPKYISKYTTPREGVAICGKVISLEKKVSSGGKLYFKFELQDPTGKMSCMYFSRSKVKEGKDISKSKSSFEHVKLNDEIFVAGNLIKDQRSNTIKMFVDSVYTCEIDEEATLSKISYTKNQLQKTIVPQPQVYNVEKNNIQTSMFEEHEYICPLLRHNTFVVFDLETTGLDLDKSKIVEIGACKIENGNIVSTFTTLIDPEMPMPISAQEVNKISDDMLKSAPLFEYVIEPFEDYCKGCIVVGHNAKNFDVPMIKNRFKDYGFDFNHPCIDTMDLHKQFDPNAKKSSLNYCMERYSLVNENAHRAMSDALATAKLFIYLANNLQLD